MYENVEADLSVKFSNNRFTDIQPHDIIELIKITRLTTCFDIIAFSIIMYSGVYSEGSVLIYDDLNASTHWIMFKFKPYELVISNSIKAKIINPIASISLSSGLEGNLNIPPDFLETQEVMEKEFEQAGIMRRITKEEYEDIKNRYRKYYNV